MFNHKPLLVSDNRSLLSYCTVLGEKDGLLFLS
jgi:hypothetical protein